MDTGCSACIRGFSRATDAALDRCFGLSLGSTGSSHQSLRGMQFGTLPKDKVWLLAGGDPKQLRKEKREMTEKIVTPDLSLYRALQKACAAYGDLPAITFGDQTVTFTEVGRQVEALARKLQGLGVGAGDQVAFILPNSFELVYSFFAPSALGAVIVPLNPVYRQKEFRHILEDSEAKVVLADPNYMGNDIQGILEAIRPDLPNLKHVVLRGKAVPGFLSLGELEVDPAPLPSDRMAPDDLAALVYTSGTTGTPKAVMHSSRSTLSAISTSEERVREQMDKMSLRRVVKMIWQYDARFLKWGRKQKSYMSPSPMHALLGYSGLLYALLLGSRLVIIDRFHPAKVLELVEKEHLNTLALAPTQVSALLNSPDLARCDTSSLLSIGMGAAPCPPDLVRRARKAFGCPVIIGFGATETGGGSLVTDTFDPEQMQAETIGRLYPGMQAKVVDGDRREVPAGQVGELAVKMGSTMLGYWKAPETTAQALDGEGWYYTGDLATIDEKGYTRIVGRKKDMIIRGGQNIFPAEIEAHLITMPGIANVSIVGVPDEMQGEAVWAFIQPKAGAKLTAQEVLAYCRRDLAPYKVPGQVRFVEQRPLWAHRTYEPPRHL
jgi:fatty-acyl-CoA synthase